MGSSGASDWPRALLAARVTTRRAVRLLLAATEARVARSPRGRVRPETGAVLPQGATRIGGRTDRTAEASSRQRGRRGQAALSDRSRPARAPSSPRRGGSFSRLRGGRSRAGGPGRSVCLHSGAGGRERTPTFMARGGAATPRPLLHGPHYFVSVTGLIGARHFRQISAAGSFGAPQASHSQ